MRLRLFTTKLYAALFAAGLLFTSYTVSAQVKIGTSPTVIGPNSNLEVEATNTKKVIVNKNDGTVVIENTPAGTATNKLLSVDAAGNVRTSALLKFVTTGSSAYSETVIPYNSFITRATLQPAPAFVSSYDATLQAFTVPETGVYTLTLGTQAIGVDQTGGVVQFQIWSTNLNDLIASQVAGVTNQFYVQIGAAGTAQLTAGDKIYILLHQVTYPNLTVRYKSLRFTAMKVY